MLTARKTEKQRIIMRLVIAGMNEGSLLTLGELHARLPYTCSVGALRTSLRFLEKGGALTREHAGRVLVLRPTLEGLKRFPS